MLYIKLFFNLGKVGFILQNSNGFTLTEVIIATGIILTVASTFLPIITIIDREQNLLSERRILAYQLHDELQQFIWGTEKALPIHYTKSNHHAMTADFIFKQENEFIKGCVEWINAKKEEEEICLYSLQPE